MDTDEFSEYYAELLDGTYDCVDRIVINAYYPMLGNSRFLILPGVQVPYLASHVLALAVRRLRSDWMGRYGYAPVLLETYVMPPHDGTCYRAANWRLKGETASIGRGYRKERASKKMIFVYPLTRDWRRELCAPAPIVNEDDDVI